MNSKRKGKGGELEAAKKLRDVYGRHVQRGQQYKGTPESPDVVGLKGIHIEVKRVEKLNLEAAMRQAKGDCGDDVPVVMHRKNRGEWMFTICVDDIQQFVRAHVRADRNF